MKNRISFIVAIAMAFSLSAAEPAGYYSSCEGKNKQSLLEALEDVIGTHTDRGYNALWEVYKQSDVRANGKIWDMYSTKEWTPGAEQCGNYSSIGDCYNREHSMPKSWFGNISPMNNDAFHIYPTDGKVNSQRSNYPYGECANGTTLPSSNGVKALGRLGNSTFSGYSGIVFEPDDEYKGDFARSYFYMAACYNNQIEDWDSPMLAGNSYPAYTTWAVNLLLKWHRQDPVSQKELDRNEVIYEYQDNRNPFIDHPEMVEYIWGDKKNESWSLNVASLPTINTPVDGSAIDMGITAINIARTTTVTIKGQNLSDDVAIAISGVGFSVSASSVTASEANTEEGVDVTISFLSSTATNTAGELTISSGNAVSKVALSASAVDGLPAQPATDITETSFVAHWTDIDKTDGARYTISVYHNGSLISDEYPMTVLASDEQITISDLEPATTYSYTISSSTLTSNEISVTTATPIPSIQLYSEEELTFSAEPEQASAAIEIMMWAENITADISIAVAEPFAVSTDLSTWSNTLTLPSEVDRFYLRLQPTAAGSYTAHLSASAGDCEAEGLDVTASVAAPVNFLEDFEADATGMDSYSPSDNYVGTAATWHFSNAGIWSSDNSIDKQSVRFGKKSNSYIEMVEDVTTGIGTISFYAKKWGNDVEATLNIQVSRDQGATWTTIATVTVADGTQYVEFSATANITGRARLRIEQSAGERLNVDNIAISPYTSSIEQTVIADWTAYSLNGSLVIENASERAVAVYSIDGTTLYNDTPVTDKVTLPLPTGLYIVTANDSSRRVLVR